MALNSNYNVAPVVVTAFTSRPMTVQSSICHVTNKIKTTETILSATNGDDDDDDDDDDDKKEQTGEVNWLEKWAVEGN